MIFVACTIGSNTIKIYVDNIEQTVSPTSILSATELSAMYNSGRGVFDIVSGVGWYR